MSSSDSPRWLHFTGVGGSGMSALAQFHARQGGRTTGSDRAFDSGERAVLRDQLVAVGVEIVPQDGSFLTAGDQPDAVVVSTAVENKVPDVRLALEHQIPLLHRSELLAQHVASHRTIAVSGTSGKSTVTAMVFAILQAAGRGPGLLTGGALADLVASGHPGNAWPPSPSPDGPPWLVVEADESDGSLVRYHPWCGLILNLGLDHKAPSEIMAMFSTFGDHVGGPLIVADDPALASLHDGAQLYGLDAGPGTRAQHIELHATGATFTVDGTAFSLRVPGLYNVRNATAAVAATCAAGVSLAAAAAALKKFNGVARRFQSVGTARGVEVIDDFAHNPDKIAAALAAARTRATGRILAVFQPHGFGPTRFLREALVATFRAELRPGDVLWMPEIYFAGGTVVRDISAADIINAVAAGGRDARFIARRGDLPAAIAAVAQAGDLVLVMGARDPSLTTFCEAVCEVLSGGN